MAPENKFKQVWLLQPILLACSPIIHMFALNPSEINKYHLSFGIIIASVSTIILFLLSSLLYRNFFKGALLTNALIILFYGSVPLIHIILFPISKYFFNFTIAGIRILRISFMLPIIIALILFWTHKYITNVKNNFFLRALIFPLIIFLGISILRRAHTALLLKRYKAHNSIVKRDLIKQLPQQRFLQGYPDIYLIILDCYSSQECYQKVCDFDNSPFIHQLKQRGFKIPSKTHCNYPATLSSLSSILNMNYHHKKITSPALHYMWKNNNVAFLLQHLGYNYVDLYRSFHLSTETPSLLKTLRHELKELCFGYFSMGRTFIQNWTPLYAFAGGYSNQTHRQLITSKLTLLKDSILLKSPKFVYAHFLIPHPPHVFDGDGNPLRIDHLKPGIDRSHYAYIESTKYINKKILEVTDRIIQQSTKPPIIILQGDHGRDYTYSGKKWRAYQILNAFHLPRGGEKLLYPTITPVNTFRLIFNYYFGTNLTLLEDKIA